MACRNHTLKQNGSQTLHSIVSACARSLNDRQSAQAQLATMSSCEPQPPKKSEKPGQQIRSSQVACRNHTLKQNGSQTLHSIVSACARSLHDRQSAQAQLATMSSCEPEHPTRSNASRTTFIHAGMPTKILRWTCRYVMLHPFYTRDSLQPVWGGG